MEEVAETMVSDVESEPRAADQREQVPASYTDALTAIYKYLPENICPTQPLPPPRVMSLYEADTPRFRSDEQAALLTDGGWVGCQLRGFPD